MVDRCCYVSDLINSDGDGCSRDSTGDGDNAVVVVVGFLNVLHLE